MDRRGFFLSVHSDPNDIYCFPQSLPCLRGFWRRMIVRLLDLSIAARVWI